MQKLYSIFLVLERYIFYYFEEKNQPHKRCQLRLFCVIMMLKSYLKIVETIIVQ